MAKKGKHPVWTCPEWMEPLRGYLEGIGGGRTLEQLMNEHEQNLFNNAPGAAMVMIVKSAVCMFERMVADGVEITLPEGHKVFKRTDGGKETIEWPDGVRISGGKLV